MEQRNATYLLILSIILGVSVLKLTDIFVLGKYIHEILGTMSTGPSAPLVGVFVFICAYLVFFILVAITTYGIIVQLSMHSDAEGNNYDVGPAVALCVIMLVISYISAIIVVVYNIIAYY